jgi:hypothetical protein
MDQIDNDVILNDVDPSEEVVKRWAYDEREMFISQDEDLILHDPKYITLMVELASAKDCPKAAYITGILDYFSMQTALYGTKEGLERFRDPSLASLPAGLPITEWAAIMRRRLAYRNGVGEVGNDQGEAMAKDLLLGISRIGQVERLAGVSSAHWVFKYHTPSFSEFLYINKQTGSYCAKKYQQLTPQELEQFRMMIVSDRGLAMNATLMAILRETRQLLNRDGNDFSWSSWQDAKAANLEMDDHLQRIERGDYSRLFDLQVLYAPTGPIQEVSLSSGWGREFLAVAERFDKELDKVKADR